MVEMFFSKLPIFFFWSLTPFIETKDISFLALGCFGVEHGLRVYLQLGEEMKVLKCWSQIAEMTQSIFKERHHCVFRVIYEYMLFACCIFCGCDSRGCPKRPKDLIFKTWFLLVKLPLASKPSDFCDFPSSHWQNPRNFLVGQCCPIFPFCLS